ncbi:MAG: hypothetical protein MPL62_17455 [Alphaproteobacteria bacterium]|nr:hypothetical protein [Alphaproteobacteria bacterium]
MPAKSCAVTVEQVLPRPTRFTISVRTCAVRSHTDGTRGAARAAALKSPVKSPFTAATCTE